MRTAHSLLGLSPIVANDSAIAVGVRDAVYTVSAMQTAMRDLIRGYLRKLGYDIVRYRPTSHPLARRRKILETFGINVVLDVGANTGQYGKQLRSIGYEGKIISFEPLGAAFAELERRASKDAHWTVHNLALGSADARTTINVAANSQSSSMLDMLPAHLEAAPQSAYVGQEEITVSPLDSLFPDLCSSEDRVYLKIDTQGFEDSVITGAANSLPFIDTIQLEMSLLALYDQQLLFGHMHARLESLGYSLVSLEPGFTQEVTGQLLQVDGVYHQFGSPRAVHARGLV